MMDINAELTGVEPSLSEKQLDRVCGLWRPIEWDDPDTDQTIIGVKVNNSKRDSFCADSDAREAK